MELLSPSPPPQPSVNLLVGLPPSAPLRHTVGPKNSIRASPLPEIAEEGSDKVYVAVSRSMVKSAGLLRWTFRQFPGQEICLLHVHQPSATIPTLLGRLPASQANDEMISAYRQQEREQMEKMLLNYQQICSRAKVKATIDWIQTEQVQKGIVELVTKHGIRKLVVGVEPDKYFFDGQKYSCMKVKKTPGKASYISKNAATFCQIWFVNKGRHMWTREAFEGPSYPLSPDSPPHGAALLARHRSKSSQYFRRDLAFNQVFLRSTSSTTDRLHGSRNKVHDEFNERGETISVRNFTNRIVALDSQSLTCLTSVTSELTSSTERNMSSEFDFKEVEELDFLQNQIIEAKVEAKKYTEEASAEILRCKRLENEAAEAINKIKDFEAACAHEIELRKEVENELRISKQEQEKHSEQRDEAMRELQKTMKTLPILDSHAREVAHRRDEAAGELKLVQTSLMSLREERKKIHRQRDEAVVQLERRRNHGHNVAGNFDQFVGFIDDSSELAEFSLSDIQTATCGFSESFKIGEGGFGCVYKGEMLNRTVAIKKLHPHNMQIQSEFQQEVNLLSRLKHPHLLTLIGVCPDAWSLVYEYLPNGNLKNRLICKNNAPPLTWKVRTRIVAEIASTLLFLQSSKPEKVIHSDLKLENILLDYEYKCKIGDLGICRLVSEETARCPSFCQTTEPKGAFPYMDPEYQRTGKLTSKSDVYSFGIIILQLLTGRSPVGLSSEVRRAVASGKLSLVLDPSAGDWPMFVARRLAELGIKCSEINSRERPELTPALVRELEQLHVAEERPPPTFFLCPIFQEIMQDPQIAADGFTYEGEALRGWLENGHETSPMTNLKLSHLNLTPNHALRSVIQDWLCQS